MTARLDSDGGGFRDAGFPGFRGGGIRGRGLQAEEVGVGAGAGEFEDEEIGVDFVDEKPIGGDVAFAVADVVAGEGVVAVGGGQGKTFAEAGDDGVELSDGKSLAEKALVVALEGGGMSDGEHHLARSAQSWSRSVYVGASGSAARRSPSAMASRVSVLGRRGPSMMKGMRFSRTMVLMQTVRTAEAERPTPSQKRVKRFLVLSSMERVRLAMGVPWVSFMCIIRDIDVKDKDKGVFFAKDGGEPPRPPCGRMCAWGGKKGGDMVIWRER